MAPTLVRQGNRELTQDLYQRAKETFQELVDLPKEAQEDRLGSLEQESPELASEVRSLLDYHTVQSLVVPPSSPKIRTRSTLSTTYQVKSWKWARTPIWALALGTPVFLLGLALVFWFEGLIQNALSQSVNAYLNETIDHRVSSFERWEREKISNALIWAQHPDIVGPIQSLINLTSQLPPDSDELHDALLESKFGDAIGQKLKLLSGCSDIKYAVWDRRMLTVCDWNQREQPELLGRFVTPSGASMLTTVLKSTPKVYLPKLGKAVTEGYQLHTSGPILSIFIPIVDPQSESVVAALMVRNYGLADEFDEMVKSWTASEDSTEVYLLDDRGTLLTNSRYESLLKRFGQNIASKKTSPPRYMVVDPGVDLSRAKPSTSAESWTPTLLAQQVINRSNGSDISGYSNYVGKRVVGAWRWLPSHQIGIAYEQEFDFAFRAGRLARWSMISLAALFSLAFVVATASLTFASASKRRLKNISEVGAYQVQELIGQGGMGRVYLAEHALLCRQSAIKVLTQGLEDLSVIGRFEREVQLASQLTHPNTIAIYDFGRNSDGLFYYAMEYINGAHLGQLVEFVGPVPPGRAIFILRQLCCALMEAHQAGVVHRDIKPQNIMVCNRGGEPDFVKLFDYGLVKSFAPGVSNNSSQTKVVVGTPRFMAPERLNSPWLADPRVDIYSVGALAYFLLTAQLPPLVTFETGMDHEQTGVETLDLPPDVVDFGELLSVCMAVEPSTRPSNMASLLRELEELSSKFPWTRGDSINWWEKHEAKLLHLVKNKRKKLSSENKLP
ncbi:MAG: serine/threonine-protein kinase [Pirellulaceae bacterium]